MLNSENIMLISSAVMDKSPCFLFVKLNIAFAYNLNLK